jgi:hypothetical protein
LPEADFPGWHHFENLAAVANGARTGRARRNWDDQMAGRPPPDRLGRSLPPFVTRERAIAWTEHPSPATVDLVTARAVPGDARVGPRGSPPGVVWVVLVSGKADPPGSECAQRADVRLAVIEVDPSTQAIRRLARTRAPVVPRPEWSALPGDHGPLEPDDADASIADDPCESAGLDDRVTVTALDFARYDLTPARRAFGLRTTLFEAYAGGGASYEALTLLAADGEDLVQVLDVPIGAYKMLAGDWNPDGTRQHETISADLVVEVRPRPDAVAADLVLHSAAHAAVGRHALPFVWNAARGQYGCP